MTNNTVIKSQKENRSKCRMEGNVLIILVAAIEVRPTQWTVHRHDNGDSFAVISSRHTRRRLSVRDATSRPGQMLWCAQDHQMSNHHREVEYDREGKYELGDLSSLA